LINNAAKLKGEVATLVIQSTSESGDGEGLAGCAAHEKVNWCCVASEVLTGHISYVFYVGPMVL